MERGDRRATTGKSGRNRWVTAIRIDSSAPAFGFFDVELSVQSISTGKVRIELYCVADGYQTSRGVGASHPVKLAIMADGKVVGSAEWCFADVICGHADPMNFSTDIDIGDTSFSLIDRIDLLKVDGLSAPCG